jgi:hypothetical protein
MLYELILQAGLWMSFTSTCVRGVCCKYPRGHRFILRISSAAVRFGLVGGAIARFQLLVELRKPLEKS